MNPFIIGISGGSGSGKTTLAHLLQEKLGKTACAILGQDSYYLDQSQQFVEDGGSINFDHPKSLDFDLLEIHLKALKSGERISVPIYDYVTHSRSKESAILEPTIYIILDGTLIFSQEKIRNCLDHLIFVETNEATRFERRLARDVKERGRTSEGVKKQFFSQVKPMHDKFVEPSKKWAKLTISGAPSVQQSLKNVEYERLMGHSLH